ncbi:hypothetical protein LZ575_18090 [Antarcticibacterium sp. 1MA-6-2]|uniref:hypothetical protein n=1 Tax=Antarcticibacterium sp. 1MA-6-2 TaxID=2908210 RepID=UPI001F1F6B7F|nr:hypothetical protein [Antarcticibacterium sp. 1MA-6-2]UJH90662.1 hypothetical protein LZ575_18090 [Antarcticibacterium sp. 1MA-6-2]
MMSQTHIGYTYWQQPDQNNMPEVGEIPLQENAEMGVGVQGLESVVTGNGSTTTLPAFDPFNDQEFYIEIFNKGQKPFEHHIQKKPSWLELSEEKGTIEDQKRLKVQVNWGKAPKGSSTCSFQVNGTYKQVTIKVPVQNFNKGKIQGFVESNGFISMEADNFSENVQVDGKGWQLIPNLGRTGAAMTSFPHEPTQQEVSKDNPYLAYDFYSFTQGKAEVEFYLSPTIDFRNQGGLEFAYSVDDGAPQVINMQGQTKDNWDTSVANNVTKVSVTVNFNPGNHTLKVWAIETGIVLQKIVIITGEKKNSYLGPPESAKVK